MQAIRTPQQTADDLEHMAGGSYHEYAGRWEEVTDLLREAAEALRAYEFDVNVPMAELREIIERKESACREVVAILEPAFAELSPNPWLAIRDALAVARKGLS